MGCKDPENPCDMIEKASPLARFVLPFPPSVNGTFRKHNGSHLSEKYREWRDHAAMRLMLYRCRHIPGPVMPEIAYRAPDKRYRDIDNLLKAPLDLLVKQGIIEDDNSRVVREIRARWVEEGEPCTVTIWRSVA